MRLQVTLISSHVGGEIVHSPRRLGSDARLPRWFGDESNGVNAEALGKPSESSRSIHADNKVIFDVGSMDDQQFKSHLKKLR